MCATCGCGSDAGHAEAPHHGAASHPHELRRVEVERAILAHNDAHADALRADLARRGIEAVGLLGGPGAGKTSLLEATLAARGPEGVAVIEGDCAGDFDARRLAACGARAAQIETGSMCHLDAHAVLHALEKLDLDGVGRLFVENVGNLVCPAPFACGESRRALLLSAAEGDDKPSKYPAAVAACDVLVITKADLLPYVDFDVERCIAAARRVRPEMPALVVSARTGAGLDAWLDWLDGS
jgi:hydrogenase nickel incorporation protein HypB